MFTAENFSPFFGTRETFPQSGPQLTPAFTFHCNT